MVPRIFPNIYFYSILFYLSLSCSKGSSSGLKNGISQVTINPTRVKEVSWKPRIFLYKNFLTHKECDHLIYLARDYLEKSLVLDDETGKNVESKARTSSGMFLYKSQDKIVSNIESRIAAWTLLPEENGEPMQILRYKKGEKYMPHVDFFSDKTNLEAGGNRVATVLMYLSNVEEGEETVFPMSNRRMSIENIYASFSDVNCKKKEYAVRPQKGDALLFFSVHPNGTTDSYSMHKSCPVIVGEKWAATKWIRVGPYGRRIQNAKSHLLNGNNPTQ